MEVCHAKKEECLLLAVLGYLLQIRKRKGRNFGHSLITVNLYPFSYREHVTI